MKCADCAMTGVIGYRTCRCGAETCSLCRVAYHTHPPRLGCATQAGRRLVTELAKVDPKHSK